MPALPIDLVHVKTDVVVVGGGGAASRAALSAARAGAKVRLAAKVPLGSGGSTVHGASEIMSMGAAGFGDTRDSSDVHFDDTMRAGKGFIDPALVRVLADEAPERIRDLIELGVNFDRSLAPVAQATDYKLIRSDFGSYARAMGVSGKTGRAFVDAIADELIRCGVAAPSLEELMHQFGCYLANGYAIFLVNASEFQPEAINTAYTARFSSAMLAHDTIGLLAGLE